ncbi:MAG: DUF5004 domain-containing protein [Flavisolibacter sp.]
MRSKTILLSILFIGSLIALSSCTKETTVNNTNDLTGSWDVVGISSNVANDWDGDGYTETDIYNTYNYCQQDIELTFDRNGYGQSRQGCNAPWEMMNWQLSNNRLDIYIPSGDINLYITQFDGSTLRGYDQVQSNGRTYNITYTLNRRY